MMAENKTVLVRRFLRAFSADANASDDSVSDIRLMTTRKQSLCSLHFASA
jgi:hypothetical protein